MDNSEPDSPLNSAIRQFELTEANLAKLKHFGKFKVAELETTELSKEDFIIQKLDSLGRAVEDLRSASPKLVLARDYAAYSRARSDESLRYTRKRSGREDIKSVVLLNMEELLLKSRGADPDEIADQVALQLIDHGEVGSHEFQSTSQMRHFVREIIRDAMTGTGS